MKPTIILVHGAYADSSSWTGVIEALAAAGAHRIVAWANPLRSIATDATALTDLVRSVEGPVVLAGHSYGGAVMTNVDPNAGVSALVYVAGFALEAGESPGDASSLAPGSTLAETLQRVPLAAGGADTYIDQHRFHHQFAADLPAEQSALMAITQRPITEAALFEASGDNPLWRSVPSWFIFGDLDHNIPVGAHRIMSERAGAKGAVEVAGASHVVGVSHPGETSQLILEAAGVTPLVQVK